MTKVISFGTLKGGTGKTNTLINIAGILAEKSKVLVIDCDPQGNATTNLGVDIRDLNRPCSRDIFEQESRMQAEDLIISEVVPALPNLYLIPSNFLLTETEMKLFMRTRREEILYKWLRKYQDTLSFFDFLMVDTNPSMSLVNQNVFRASDSIIMVTDMGFNGVLGAQVFRYLWGKKAEDLEIENKVNALIVNNTDRRMTLTSQIKDYCTTDEDLSDITMMPDIPCRAIIKKAEMARLPITLYAAGSDVSILYRDLTENLIERKVL